MKYKKRVLYWIVRQSIGEQFVKYFAGQVYEGRLTPKVIDQFSSIVRKTFAQLINDSMNERLKNALAPAHHQPTIETPAGAGNGQPAATKEQKFPAVD